MFVVIEGVDAAGKATQSKTVAERLMRDGRLAQLYSFPRYDTPLGKSILAVLKGDLRVMSNPSPGSGKYKHAEEDEARVLQALMTADKYAAAADMLIKMRTGHDIVCDRWTPSAECYGAADGLDVEWIRQIQSQLPIADMYVYIEVSEEEALRRRPNLRDRYEQDRGKQALVRQRYREMWENNDQHNPGRWTIIDGHGTPDEVTQRIMVALTRVLAWA